MMECTTTTILKCIKDHGWEVPQCPNLLWLDKLGHDVIVCFHTKSGYSAFHVKYDPEVKDFTYFRALDPLVIIREGKGGL